MILAKVPISFPARSETIKVEVITDPPAANSRAKVQLHRELL